MSSGRFWYLPLKDVAPDDQRDQLAARDEVREADLPVAYNVPSKLFAEGVRTGHVLALHDGEKVVALARVLALDPGSLHWRRLPLLTAAEPVATPELSEVEPHEQAKFTVGIGALLRDVPPSALAAPEAAAAAYSPAGPASNVILYGPPGTGKTYSLRRRALELLGDATARKAPFDEVQREWDRLCEAGQIVFCTFHQAFAYEEFVEGLRAVTDGNGNVQYRVEDGIFKALAKRAAGDTGAAVEPTFDLLWSGLVEELTTQSRQAKDKQGGDCTLARSPNGHVSVSEAKGNAAAQVVTRDVMEKVWSDRAELGDDPSVSALKGYHTGSMPIWIVYQQLRRHAQQLAAAAKRRDYVLVIDEINRANIARVFGELITLLEPDKRLGLPGALRVRLPASKELFGVPPNLHVLGTMNTADRSIALMDVALRRRFAFEEMMPDAGELDRVLAAGGVDEALRKRVNGVFAKLNERLRYLYDREHQVGHSYFLAVRSLADLRAVFADRVLPLLQEYFFGQWDKIALVLGYPLTAEGRPRDKDLRDANSQRGTFLIAQKLDEKAVLGFDHDEYVDQIAWDVHPSFCPHGMASDSWLAQAFDELLGKAAG